MPAASEASAARAVCVGDATCPYAGGPADSAAHNAQKARFMNTDEVVPRGDGRALCAYTSLCPVGTFALELMASFSDSTVTNISTASSPSG